MKKQIKYPDQFSLSDSESEKVFLSTPTWKNTKTHKRVSFCIFKKASLTVEAAFAVPLFFMAVICIISIMGVYTKTLDTMVTLRTASERTAAAAALTDEDLWIELPLTASHKPVFLPSGLGVLNVSCIGRSRAWTGRSTSDTPEKDSTDNEYVYVAENGSVYHTFSDCSHIDLSIHQVNSQSLSGLRNSNGGKYHACEKCAAAGKMSSVVYITDDGDKYHNSLECSGLSRTVKIMEKSEVEDLPLCSRCGSRHR